MDSLNFSFWTEEGAVPYRVRYRGKQYTGYWSLCAAINRALDEGVRLTDASVMAEADADLAAQVFRSDSSAPIPLAAERVRVLRQVGAALQSRWGGSFVNMVRAAGGSARKLVALIVDTFECFRDGAMWPPSNGSDADGERAGREEPNGTNRWTVPSH